MMCLCTVLSWLWYGIVQNIEKLLNSLWAWLFEGTLNTVKPPYYMVIFLKKKRKKEDSIACLLGRDTVRSSIIWYCTAMTEAEHVLEIILTKNTPNLSLTGELWGVSCRDWGENRSCYHGTTLYVVSLVGIVPELNPTLVIFMWYATYFYIG